MHLCQEQLRNVRVSQFSETSYKTWQKENWHERNWKYSVKIRFFLSVYIKGGSAPSGSAYVSLRGWPFDSERDLEAFSRNQYSGQVMSKNKINILSRNETKRNYLYSIPRRLDNKWKTYIKNVARKHQSQGGFIQKFGLLPLYYPC